MPANKEILDVQPNGGLTRRELLVEAAKHFPEVIFGIGICGSMAMWLWDQLVNPPKRLASVSLEATATSLLEGKKQTSFQEEEDGFSNEFFKRVRAGVYAIDVFIKRGDDGKSLGGTSWLARKEDGAYYFVTNKHVVKSVIDNPKEFSGLHLWRPGIDGENRFEAGPIQIAYSNILDLAVVRCEGSFQAEAPVESLNWEDNITLQPGEKMLVVGFPKEFRIAKPNFLTEGATLTVISVDPKIKQWIAKGLVSQGNSGSPVVINRGGSPIVVGIVSQTGDMVFEGKKIPVAKGNELGISELMTLFEAD